MRKGNDLKPESTCAKFYRIYIDFFVDLFKRSFVCNIFGEISLFAVYEFSITCCVSCLKIILSPLISDFISDYLKNCILMTFKIAEK